MARIQRDHDRLQEQKAREAEAAKAAQGARGAGGPPGPGGGPTGSPAEARGPGAQLPRQEAPKPEAKDDFRATAEEKPKAPDTEARDLERVATDPAPRVAANDDPQPTDPKTPPALAEDARRERVEENTSGLDRRRAVPRAVTPVVDHPRAEPRIPSEGAARRRSFSVVNDQGQPVMADDARSPGAARPAEPKPLGPDATPEARALDATRRLDAEKQPPLARAIRGIDEASKELEAGRFDAAAKLFAAEGARAREAATRLPERSVERETLDVVGRNMEARAKLLGPSTTPRDLETKARELAGAARRALWDAHVFRRDGADGGSAKVLEAVGRDSMSQAELMYAQAKAGRTALGQSVSRTYRDIVNASFDRKIAEAGSIHNFFTGHRDKLEKDKVKMNEVFDELDRRMKKDGVELSEAWHQMFDDHRVTSAKDMPHHVTAGEAARFLRDHEVTKGLLMPMTKLSDGLATGDAKKIDAAQGDLVRSLRDNDQWDLARSVLDGYTKNAKTEEGKRRAQGLEDNESGERWAAFGEKLVKDELPVLVLSGVLSGGAGWGVKAATTAMKWGPRAVKAATVAGEIGSFVTTERLLNDAINGKRADWSPGALAKDAAIVGTGMAVFKGIGAGWRRFRAKNPKLGGTSKVEVPTGGAAAEVAQPILRKTLERADRVSKELGELVASDWSKALGKRAGKLQQRVADYADDVKVARDLLARSPNEVGRKALDDLLASSERILADARAYRGLTPPAPIKGRAATADELAALEANKAAFRKSEGAMRTKLGDDLQGAGQDLYRLQAELAGVRISALDPAHSGFKVDPVAASRAHRAKFDVSKEANVGYAELTLGRGNVRALGPAASGSGPGSLGVRSGRYAGDARVLQKQPGQHGFPRSNDSEVQLLEEAAKVLEANPKSQGVLRIFTENPPCASCQRVMARFLRDHPNIRIEVTHGG